MDEKNYGEYTDEEVAKSLKTIQDICSLNKDDCGVALNAHF